MISRMVPTRFVSLEPINSSLFVSLRNRPRWNNVSTLCINEWTNARINGKYMSIIPIYHTHLHIHIERRMGHKARETNTNIISLKNLNNSKRIYLRGFGLVVIVLTNSIYTSVITYSCRNSCQQYIQLIKQTNKNKKKQNLTT